MQFTSTFDLLSKSDLDIQALLDGSIRVIQNLEDLVLEDLMAIDVVAFVACLEGKMQVDANGESYRLERNDVMVCTPGTLIGNYMSSPDFSGLCVLMSTKLMRELANSLLHLDSDWWRKAQHLLQSPVVRLTEEQRQIGEAYRLIIRSHKQKDNPSKYDNIIIQDILRTIVGEMLVVMETNLPDEIKTKADKPLTRAEIIFKDFIQLLMGGKVKHRAATWYADKLCITPKYLSQICKTVSGKTAKAIICDTEVDEIKRLLLNTDISIKEIADRMEYPSLSFFGKFTKAHLGESPTNLRKDARNS
ncbi:MAG: helix-turn-helix domain-containing protein [Bacteroidales bacterium]|nr:helix-turn-helix domain-containing protein [Bacteroidales bacterium]